MHVTMVSTHTDPCLAPMPVALPRGIAAIDVPYGGTTAVESGGACSQLVGKRMGLVLVGVATKYTKSQERPSTGLTLVS